MTDLGTNQAVGTMELSESDYGIVFTPHLSGIPAGLHGFHVHANPSCDSAEKDGKTVVGGGAGGHY
ncbi:superoxide dismutase family protein, partial [Escherichia coli]|nr:superoxide dismutase family protein [Escherichia coli]